MAKTINKKDIEKIDGTIRYVKIGSTVYDTISKDNTPTKTICECLFCGERFGGNVSGGCAIYCKNCKTKEGREKILEENKKITNERNVTKIC